jgi:hypothetical protein
MAELIYAMCALTALLCAWLLLQSWRRSGYKLLLWSGLCFVGQTVNNLLLIADKLIFPNIDLLPWRLAAGMVAMLLLLYGLIWEAE